MAEITITKKLEDLQKVFDKAKRVLLSTTPNIDLEDLSSLAVELPVLEDSFNYDSGAASIDYIKLTTGQRWASYTTAGDPDVSMQVASVAGSITDIFLNKKGSAVTMTNTIGGKTFTGQGYSTEIKKVNGALLLLSEDGTQLIALPNVEMYANAVIEGGTPAYFNVQIMPKANSDGADIILLEGAVTPVTP